MELGEEGRTVVCGVGGSTAQCEGNENSLGKSGVLVKRYRTNLVMCNFSYNMNWLCASI